MAISFSYSASPSLLNHGNETEVTLVVSNSGLTDVHILAVDSGSTGFTLPDSLVLDRKLKVPANGSASVSWTVKVFGEPGQLPSEKGGVIFVYMSDGFRYRVPHSTPPLYWIRVE